MDGGWEENAEVSPGGSVGDLLLQWSMPSFVLSTMDRRKYASFAIIQVPPLPTFVL